ncbi:MAG: serine hydrolase [Gemmatimonadota bacterium]
MRPDRLHRLHHSVVLLAACALWALHHPLSAQDAAPYDIVVRGGRVLDGSGNPWFAADIGIRDGRIVAVGQLGAAPAARVVDASGRYVAPGFIDIHSHADDGNADIGEATIRTNDPSRKSAPNVVSQGVTTVVVNHDGRSPWPIRDQRALLERQGVGPNVMLMVGHGTVRRRVMGDDFQRPATETEVSEMRALVRQALSEGAVGISAGLEYVPGRYSTTDEVVSLVEELVPSDGVYISHERSEGADPMWFWPSQDPPGPPTLQDAVLETIDIGRRTGAKVVASHIKAKGAHWWGSSGSVIQLIERARDEGVRVWADQYPYATSGSDGNTVLIPGWATSADARGPDAPGPAEVLRRNLDDPETAARIRRDITHEIRRRGGADRVVVLDYPRTEWVGKNLQEIADGRGVDPVQMAIDLQLEGDPDRRGGGRLRGFSMSEDDVEHYAAQPWVATASDGGIAVPEDGPVHPRYYGTFPRKIRHYALNAEALSLEAAIRSQTSLPARIMGLQDRGEIRVGHWADLVVFDLETISDRATVFEPHQHAEGIDHVLVNGAFVVEDGRILYATPGRVIAAGQTPTRASQPTAPDQTAEQVDEIFARWNTTETPGCAVGVRRTGQTVLERAYGMADLEHRIANTSGTLFEGGSLSKQFTAAAVVLLALEGALSLDDDVRTHIPEVPDYGHTITLKHLLTHTSGLRDWGSVAGISGWGRGQRTHDHDWVLDIVSRQSALNFVPGHEYSYSNTGYNLLAMVVSRVSGIPFARFSEERIFEPLGLGDTQWRDDYRRIVPGRSAAYRALDGGRAWEIDRPIEDVHGNGGILTTVADLGIWNAALEDGRLGGSEFVRMMHDQGRLNDGSEIVYASGLRVEESMGVPSVTHTGSTAGYRAFLARYPEQDLSVAMLCNASNVPTGSTGSSVARVYLGSAVSDRQAPDYEAASRPEDARRVGLYHDPVTGELRELEYRDGIVRDGSTPLLPLSEREFQVGTSDRRYVFDAGDGRVGFEVESWEYTHQRWEPVNPWSPGASALAEFAGTYHSADAETTYVVSADGGPLTVWQRPDESRTLEPTYRDTFRMGGSVVRFRRDASGRVEGLSLSLGRVYDMRFERVDP